MANNQRQLQLVATSEKIELRNKGRKMRNQSLLSFFNESLWIPGQADSNAVQQG